MRPDETVFHLFGKLLMLVESCFITCSSSADAKSSPAFVLHPLTASVPTYAVCLQGALPSLPIYYISLKKQALSQI